MTDASGAPGVRRTLMLALLVVVAVGGWKLAHRPAEARAFDGDGARLAERVDAYLALRRKDDWVSLYAMAAPEHREAVDIASFLGMYGHGVMRILDIEATDTRIDPVRRTAVVAMHTEAELVPDKLPPQYRASLAEPHPEHLRRSIDHELPWVWRNGDWYFEMDPELVTGRDASGSQIILQHLEQP